MLAYDEVGSGRSVFFLHGAFSSRRVFGYQLLSLSEYARVIAVDLPGYGDSPLRGSGLWLDEATEGVMEIIQGTADEAPLVVGWSLGGMVAAAVGARCSVAIPVLVATRGEPLARGAADQVAKRIRKDFPRFARSIVRAFTSVPVSQETEEWLYSMALGSGIEVHYQSLLTSRLDFDTLDLQRAVSVHGRLDRVVEIAEHVRGGRQIEFECSGHMPFLEERERFDGEIRDLLQS